MIRTFLAVELGHALIQRLAQVQEDVQQRLSRGLTKDVRVSWVQPASLHLTVKFLGDTDERLIGSLRAGLAPVATQLPLTVPLDRLGVFPRVQQPRVLWAGPSADWERGEEACRLADFHRTVEEACRAFGFEPEGRPWSPHVTLARIRAGERQFGQAVATTGMLDRRAALGVLRIASLVLMRSDLHPSGSIYTRLWRVPGDLHPSH
jgi:RNA 2',3'-cyclic 3'-phosphodiesterase